jgi:outer membrane protein W
MRRSGLVLAAVLLLVGAGAVHAQVEPGDAVMTVNLGYAVSNFAGTDITVDGGQISLAYEKLDWGKPASFGFAIAYMSLQGEDDVTPVSNRTRTSIQSLPLYLGGKYWLGQSKIQGYLGVALGVYFSWLEITLAQTGEEVSRSSATDFGIAVPLGGTLSISQSMFINANYTLNWLWDSRFLKDDLLHTFNVGLGWKLGK